MENKYDDMHIDLLNFGSRDITGDYLDNLFSPGFLPTIITKPTRVGRSPCLCYISYRLL